MKRNYNPSQLATDIRQGKLAFKQYSKLMGNDKKEIQELLKSGIPLIIVTENN